MQVITYACKYRTLYAYVAISRSMMLKSTLPVTYLSSPVSYWARMIGWRYWIGVIPWFRGWVRTRHIISLCLSGEISLSDFTSFLCILSGLHWSSNYISIKPSSSPSDFLRTQSQASRTKESSGTTSELVRRAAAVQDTYRLSRSTWVLPLTCDYKIARSGALLMYISGHCCIGFVLLARHTAERARTNSRIN